jgi:hypothetical protein
MAYLITTVRHFYFIALLVAKQQLQAAAADAAPRMQHRVRRTSNIAMLLLAACIARNCRPHPNSMDTFIYFLLLEEGVDRDAHRSARVETLRCFDATCLPCYRQHWLLWHRIIAGGRMAKQPSDSTLMTDVLCWNGSTTLSSAS